MKIIRNLAFASGLVPVGNRRGKAARAVVIASVGVVALAAALVRTALATPPFNIVSGTVLARASFVDPVDIKFKIGGESVEVVHAPEARETVIQQVVIGPGGHTGWHSHPGPAVVLIKAGALAVYSSDDPTCTPRIYLAGEAFLEYGQNDVLLGRNLSPSENCEVWVTYFDVPSGGPFRLDAPDPGNCNP